MLLNQGDSVIVTQGSNLSATASTVGRSYADPVTPKAAEALPESRHLFMSTLRLPPNECRLSHVPFGLNVVQLAQPLTINVQETGLVGT